MRIEYIREMKRSYMTVTGEGAGESYETGMLAKNQISGLLKMKIKYMDGVPVYCYDITSRQPVSRLFESRPAGENQVRSFFLQLYETLDRMEAYLLGDGGILLDPELIYADPETFQMGFCVVPGVVFIPAISYEEHRSQGQGMCGSYLWTLPDQYER